MGAYTEEFPFAWLSSVNDVCSSLFVVAATVHPSAENQVRVGFLEEAISESWVSIAFSHHYLRTQPKNPGLLGAVN